MEQKRFLLALLLSAAILFGWEYFLRRNVAPPQNNENEALPAATVAMQAATPDASPTLPVQTTQGDVLSPTPAQEDVVPQRTVTVETPLYRVRFDNRGAVATSWVIKQKKRLNDSDKESELPLYSIAGTKSDPQQLELISPEGLKREPREVPLRLLTGDAGRDATLDSKNYRVSGVEGESGEAQVRLASGDAAKRIDFILRDPATGLDVTKSLTFYSDRYGVDLSINASQGEQRLPSVKLSVGPSIGDQGVPHYSFYSVAPEAIYAIPDDEAERHIAADINKAENSPGRLVVPETVDWAGVGDTYFAMVAIPPARVQGVEYRTSNYEHQTNGEKEERHLISGFVPIPADGALTRLYVGPKDHYLLQDASKEISAAVGREVNLEGLIDYGFGRQITRPIAVPILAAIKYLNRLTGSYGIAIILFTIIIYSLFFPLKWRSSKSMKKAQKLAPRMKELQAKIKGMKQNDPRLKELQMEQLRLMKEGNPLGGCLPILIQMPFLFALFRAITISIDFRQSSFLWMPDLSASDPWHLLPFLMAGSMLILQLITPAPSADPLQRKMMAVVLPVMMLYMMWSAPAGLLVYWLVGNIVGFTQQLLINRLIKSEDDEEPPAKSEAETRSSRSAKKLGGATRVSQA